MEDFEQRPARFGSGRAIEKTYQAKPESSLLLRTERAAALYALDDLQAAFEELWVVTRRRPDYLRAQRGMLELSARLLQSGARDPRILQAHREARQRLGLDDGP
jgi:hypothetical protein